MWSGQNFVTDNLKERFESNGSQLYLVRKPSAALLHHADAMGRHKMFPFSFCTLVGVVGAKDVEGGKAGACSKIKQPSLPSSIPLQVFSWQLLVGSSREENWGKGSS